MEIRLLGPVDVVDGTGHPVSVGGPKERAVLALLALDAGRAVPEARLVDAVWGDEPPRTAARTLQSYLSRVRRALDTSFALEGQQGGWLLRPTGGAVDVVRFETFIANGKAAADRGDHLGAALALADALRLWRGPALGEFAGAAWATVEVARLEELRLHALEERVEAELRCGRHHELIGDLEAACRAHPYRERLWGQRMVALYRAGRQADALRAYQQLRHTLTEELGIDPSPALVRLEQAILTQHASLDIEPAPIDADSGAASDGHGARSSMTLLFTDVVETGGFVDRAGGAAFDEIRRAHFHLLHATVTDAGGVAVRNLGDGVLAAFPEAVDAIGCAVTIQQAVARANQRSRDRGFAVRVGLHVGAPPAGDDFFDPALMTVKRLCDVADGGQILASAATVTLLGARDDVALGDEVVHQLRGVAEPVAARPIVWSEQGRAVAPPLRALHEEAFVGRDVERATLADAWQRAQTGGPAALFIAGEPGIGKTSLAVQVALDAARDGAVVLFGRCFDESPVPFQPFVEAIGHHVDVAPVDELRRALRDQAADLAPLVPAIAWRLPEVTSVPPTGTEMERYRLFEAVCGMLEALGAEAPVMLVLDDLHWADRPTLQLLSYVVRHVADTPLLVVGTYRDTDLVRTHPMAETLAELRRAQLVDRVRLSGLSEDDVVALVAAKRAPSPADRALGRALWQETEGSPLFLREIIRHLAETEAIVRAADGRWEATRRIEHLGIPEGVKEVIGRRLTRLSDDANTVLRTGSVLGRELQLDVLEHVTGLPSDRVLDALDDATAAGVIEEVGGTVGRWVFTHALVREALYEELSLTRRVRMHQRVAEALEALAPSEPGPHLAELAYHFTQAAVAGSAPQEVDYARRAGEHALAMAGFEEAARHFEAAYEVADDAGFDRSELADLLMAKGDAWFRAADVRLARATYERVVALIGDRDPERLARAALGHAGAKVRLWWAELVAMATRTVELLERAAAALPDEDSALRAMVLGALAQELHWDASARDRRERMSADAVAMARRLDDPEVLLFVLCARCMSVLSPRYADEYVAYATECLAIAERLGDHQVLGNVNEILVVARLQSGDIDGARAALARAEHELTITRDPGASLVADSMRGSFALLEGRFAEAEALCLRAFHKAQQVRDPNAFMVYGPAVYMSRYFQGRHGEMLSFARHVGDVLPVLIGTDRAAVAMLFGDLGLVDEAKRSLESLDLLDETVVPYNAFWAFAMYCMARALWRVGDASTSAILYEQLAPYSDQNAIGGWITVGSVHLPLALCASACGRHDDAEGHFVAATEAMRRHGAPVLVVDAVLHHALALAARGSEADAERILGMLDEVITVAGELGMNAHSSEAASLKRRLLGEDSEETGPRPGMSRRDRARARLVTLGRSVGASWTKGRTDDELARRFASPRAQRTFFAAFARAFQPATAHGFEGDIGIELRPVDHDGDPASSNWWTIEIRGRKATARQGVSDDPAIVLHADYASFLRLAAGELHAARVIVDGLVEIEGDAALALTINDMFGLDEPIDIGA